MAGPKGGNLTAEGRRPREKSTTFNTIEDAATQILNRKKGPRTDWQDSLSPQSKMFIAVLTHSCVTGSRSPGRRICD